MKITSILILSFLQICFVLNSISQENLTLSDAIQKSLENNYQIRVSKLNLDIAKSNNTWGTAGRYPYIGIGAMQANRYDDMPSRMTPGTRDKYNTYSVSPFAQLQWTLFNGFAINITKDKLASLERITEGNAAIIVENTIQAVILAYNRVLLENEKKKVIEEILKLSSDRYNNILLKKDLGSAVTFDVLQAQNAYLSDSSTYLLQQMNYKNSLRNLNLLLGENINTIYNPIDNFIVPVKQYEMDTLLSKMLSNNKTLTNQYINQEILRKNIKLNKSSLYPSISLNSGYDKSYSSVKFDGSSASNSNAYDYYANFSLSYTLFNGGNIKSAIQNAKIEENIGQIQLDEITHRVSIQLANSYELFIIRKQLYLVSEEKLKTNKLNLQIAEEKFNSGVINSFNYRDVQIMFLNSSFEKLEAIYNLIETNSELLRLTGSIISVQ
ncbi:MAG: TolC family protein [Bacteroidales bacterium]|nr:TolC family protein [Bacteroidales bacterium]